MPAETIYTQSDIDHAKLEGAVAMREAAALLARELKIYTGPGGFDPEFTQSVIAGGIRELSLPPAEQKTLEGLLAAESSFTATKLDTAYRRGAEDAIAALCSSNSPDYDAIKKNPVLDDIFSKRAERLLERHDNG